MKKVANKTTKERSGIVRDLRKVRSSPDQINSAANSFSSLDVSMDTSPSEKTVLARINSPWKRTSLRKSRTQTADDGSPSGKMIALQLLDTGWRVALPILVLTYIGIKTDRQNGTTPLYSLIGFFLSLFMATVLVYKQIKSVYPDFFKELRNKGANK